jgi:hypothetical protein
MTVLRPQSIVKINGQAIPFLDWSIDNNVAAQADTFKITFAIKKLEEVRYKGVTLQEYFFFTNDDIFVEILLGFGDDNNKLQESSMKLMINGFADKPCWTFETDQMVLEGRDKTALFLDNKITKKFANYTVEQVIRELGAKRGLKVEIAPDVAGRTMKVGKVSNGEQCLLVDDQTEWDLMTKLAKEEGRELFVRHNTLVYRNPIAPQKLASFKFVWRKNMENCKLDRVFKNTKNISVTIRSWNAGMKRRNEYTAYAGPDAGRTKQQPKNKTHRKRHDTRDVDAQYTLNVPGLSPEQVKNMATQLANDIHKHELNLQFDVPISIHYDMDKVIYLDGIPIPAKQYFIPKSIHLSFDAKEGGKAAFTCVNHVLPVKGDSD